MAFTDETMGMMASRYVLCLAVSVAAFAQAQVPQYTVLTQLKIHPRPFGGLVQELDGRLYSTTAGYNGGRPGQVFGITTAGKLTTLTVLSGYSKAGLLLATNGGFYGTTFKGGDYNSGRVFEVTPTGKMTTLHAFCAETQCPDGASPAAALIQATDGNLYGTTAAGGPGCTVYADQCGTIFKMTLAGKLTTLYTFCLQTGCPDGQSPFGSLLQASDGNFYGTTGGGGTMGWGTVFRITPAGELTTLHSFCSESGCADGGGPLAALVQGPDGALYGTTQSYSTIYRLTLDGALFQVLYQFCSQPGCPDGFSPDAPLILATDGNFYGTTAADGPHGLGTIFSITPAGVLTTLYAFCSAQNCSDGAQPFSPLFQATDGNFYGTTFGATNGTGDGVYRLSTGLAPFVSPLPAFGKSGRKVNILGINLTGATAVTFNGSPVASFAVNATGSAITTKVPAGATSGAIRVTLPDGSTLSSRVPFQVR